MCSSRRDRGGETRTSERHSRTTLVADDIRASDEDREKVVTELTAHAGAGRLSHEELEQRTEAAYAARTMGDLRKLLADLPGRPVVGERRTERRSSSRREEFRVFLWVSALLIGIWALTGADYFWPIWPIAGWGMTFLLPGCGVHGHKRRDARPAEGLVRV